LKFIELKRATKGLEVHRIEGATKGLEIHRIEKSNQRS
jgi:hypothetical protein